MTLYIHVLMRRTIVGHATIYVVPPKARKELIEKGYTPTDKIQISPGYYNGSTEPGYSTWQEEQHYQIWKLEETT
jgi:hypothetical protein